MQEYVQINPTIAKNSFLYYVYIRFFAVNKVVIKFSKYVEIQKNTIPWPIFPFISPLCIFILV